MFDLRVARFKINSLDAAQELGGGTFLGGPPLGHGVSHQPTTRQWVTCIGELCNWKFYLVQNRSVMRGV